MQKTEMQTMPQEQLPPYFVSIREFLNERQRFTMWPEFQRREVWRTIQCQALIDSILLGDPIPSLEGYAYDGINGDELWGMIDGHQRMSAILNFVDDGFKTWTPSQKRRYEPNSNPPCRPGLFHSELDILAKNHFLRYRLQINKVRKSSEDELITRFIRINKGVVPLSAAENLRAYRSKANESAHLIENHLFWENFFTGSTKRGQVFQSSLHLLALVLSPEGYVDLQNSEYLYSLASGTRDNNITDEKVIQVLDTLDKMSILFHGLTFTERAITVPMFQAVFFLEKAGYKITKKEKGVLTTWIQNVLELSHSDRNGYWSKKSVGSLMYVLNQKTFWERNKRHLFTLVGVQSLLS